MNILILGGTQFVGKHITKAALKKFDGADEDVCRPRHSVTLFNRGKTNRNGADGGVCRPQGVTQLIGDRDGDLDALNDKSFDVVIDVCGYLPRVVRESAELLKDSVSHYIFISTVSVYDFNYTNPIDIDSPLATLEDEEVEEITGETYGGLKVLCEDEVLEIYGDNCTIIRPGYIVGPDDHTDRFGYWVKRVAQGGEMIVPDNDDQPMQFIDVRDLAEWTISLAEKKQAGIYNAIGPDEPVTFKSLLTKIITLFKSNAELVKVSEQFIDDEELTIKELPMLFSHKDKDHYNLMQIDVIPSVAAGLNHRAIDDTIQDSFDYIKSLPTDYEFKAGLTVGREKELLDKWREK